MISWFQGQYDKARDQSRPLMGRLREKGDAVTIGRSLQVEILDLSEAGIAYVDNNKDEAGVFCQPWSSIDFIEVYIGG